MTRTATTEPPVLLADLLKEGANEDEIRAAYEVSRDPLGREVVDAVPARKIAKRAQVTQAYIADVRMAWAIEPDARRERRKAYVLAAVASVPLDDLRGSAIAIAQSEAATRAGIEYDRRFPEVGSSAPNADRSEFDWFKRTHPERWQAFRAALDEVDRS